MKKKCFGILAIISLFLLIAFPLIPKVANAANTADVTATVTAQEISIALDGTNGSVAFLTVPVNDVEDTTSNGVNDTEAVQNTGNVTVDLEIMADDSTSSGLGWNMAADPGAEDYSMDYCITTCDTTPSWVQVGIAPSTVDLKTGLTASSSQAFDLKVYTPTSTSDYETQTITVTIQATLP